MLRLLTKYYSLKRLGYFLSPGRISPLAFIDSASIIDPIAFIYQFSKVVNSKIGANSYLAPSCSVVNCEIGNYCSIGAQVKIGMGFHPVDKISTSPLFYSSTNPLKKNWSGKSVFSDQLLTKIGHDVWIGYDAFIKDGVTIGNGAVIGARAVVTKDVAPYSIVMGVPAKEIRKRFDNETIDLLLKSEWWYKPESELKSKLSSFQSLADREAITELIKP